MKAVCVHHWILDSSDYGRCYKCSAEKDFAKLQAKIEQDNPHRASSIKHHKVRAQINLGVAKRGRTGRPIGAVSSSR